MTLHVETEEQFGNKALVHDWIGRRVRAVHAVESFVALGRSHAHEFRRVGFRQALEGEPEQRKPRVVSCNRSSTEREAPPSPSESLQISGSKRWINSLA